MREGIRGRHFSRCEVGKLLMLGSDADELCVINKDLGASIGTQRGGTGG